MKFKQHWLPLYKQLLHIDGTLHIVTIFKVCAVETQWNSPLNERRFITRRKFWNEQALSAELIYSDTVYTHRSEAYFIGNKTQRCYHK